MNKKIIIRYSELTLKGKNKNEFIAVLFSNITNKLNSYNLDFTIKKSFDKIMISPNDNSSDYLKPLSEIVGIS